MDQISDMLARIMNAQAVRSDTVDMPYSNVKFGIAKILSKSGFIQDVDKVGRKEKRFLRISLKYTNHVPALRMLRRVSKPGQRVYVSKGKLHILKGGRMRIISTSQGLMADREAHKAGAGGEVICEAM